MVRDVRVKKSEDRGPIDHEHAKVRELLFKLKTVVGQIDQTEESGWPVEYSRGKIIWCSGRSLHTNEDEPQV